MKQAKLYIFDVDGTILDSMKEWEYLGRHYLQAKGITPPDDLEAVLKVMTLEEGAAYFQTLGASGTAEQIKAEMLSGIYDAYRLTIPLKPGMKQLLTTLFQKQTAPLCVLTTSERDCVINAFTRLGILPYFQDIYTSSMLGMSKTTGAIYQKVCELYHTSPKDTVVFEDALHAIRSAKEAGCYVYAVPEASFQKDWEQIKAAADEIFQVK
jgi:HAD superfamily hydrolase (TIGR01509 family)